MATNVFVSRFTSREVETALERALTAVQSINGLRPGSGGEVIIDELRLEKGEPAYLEQTLVRYAAGPSGTELPAGPWSETVPQPEPGCCLWTRVTMTFNSGSPVEFYTVARMGENGKAGACVELVLPAAGWAEGEQTVSVPQATDSAAVTVAPAPGDGENFRSYLESGVRCAAQGSGTLTFRCDQAPARDLTVNVRIDDVQNQ